MVQDPGVRFLALVCGLHFEIYVMAFYNIKLYIMIIIFIHKYYVYYLFLL